MDFNINHLKAHTRYTVTGSECDTKVQFIAFEAITKPNGKFCLDFIAGFGGQLENCILYYPTYSV